MGDGRWRRMRVPERALGELARAIVQATAEGWAHLEWRGYPADGREGVWGGMWFSTGEDFDGALAEVRRSAASAVRVFRSERVVWTVELDGGEPVTIETVAEEVDDG